tara:strand:+ start:4215 stop:5120 length:906 start_codon:yes stop_codon:yes gene_type:complete
MRLKIINTDIIYYPYYIMALPVTLSIFITFLILAIVCRVLYKAKESFSGFTTTQNCFDNYFDMIVCICIPERKEHMTNTFRQWGIKNVTFFDAYLKKDYSHQHFIDIGFLNKDYNDYLNLGRICCHYSALSVYKSFLNSSSKRLLVFEDDLRTDTYKDVIHFNSVLNPILQAVPKNWDYLNFSKCYDFCTKNEDISNRFWSIPVRPLCRTAIALNRKSAKIILENTSEMKHEPGDKMIGALVKEKRFKAYATKDIKFLQHREEFGSNLGNTLNGNPRMCTDTYFGNNTPNKYLEYYKLLKP